MQFTSVEDAYVALASYVNSFIDGRKWDQAGCYMSTYDGMTKGRHWLKYQGVLEEKGGFEANPTAMWVGLDAAAFIRDDLLKKTNQRIWGLNFILYSEGKFKLDFEYDKPDGYEE